MKLLNIYDFNLEDSVFLDNYLPVSYKFSFLQINIKGKIVVSNCDFIQNIGEDYFLDKYFMEINL